MVPTEEWIDLATLSFGDAYPGRYEGSEFSTDSHGNVTDDLGRVAVNPQGIPALVRRLKGNHGRFRVTSQKGVILVRIQTDVDSWTTLYGGMVAKPFDFGTEGITPNGFEVTRLVPWGSLPRTDSASGRIPVSPAQRWSRWEARPRWRGLCLRAKRRSGRGHPQRGPTRAGSSVKNLHQPTQPRLLARGRRPPIHRCPRW